MCIRDRYSIESTSYSVVSPVWRLVAIKSTHGLLQVTVSSLTDISGHPGACPKIIKGIKIIRYNNLITLQKYINMSVNDVSSVSRSYAPKSVNSCLELIIYTKKYINIRSVSFTITELL